MNVKIIKSAEDYEAAMTRLSALMSLDPEPNWRHALRARPGCSAARGAYAPAVVACGPVHDRC